MEIGTLPRCPLRRGQDGRMHKVHPDTGRTMPIATERDWSVALCGEPDCVMGIAKTVGKDPLSRYHHVLPDEAEKRELDSRAFSAIDNWFLDCIHLILVFWIRN